MQIRFFEPPDRARIIDIYNQAIKTGISTADTSPVAIEDRITWFEKHTPENYPIYVAQNEGDILGWCSLSPYRPGRMAVRFTAEISYYVDSNFQRMGVATKLIQHAISDCPRMGIKNIFGILLETNIPSEQLLLKLGFDRWGLLPNVADFNGEECSHIYLGKRIQT